VRFGDGCATVSGYKLPLATDAKSGRRERGQAPSQDTGLIVLVAIAHRAISFSVKEKDETSHPTVSGGFAFSRRFAGA